MAQKLMNTLNCENLGLADQELIQLFDNVDLEDVSFIPGVIQAIHQGNILCNNINSPSNFSSLCYWGF